MQKEDFVRGQDLLSQSFLKCLAGQYKKKLSFIAAKNGKECWVFVLLRILKWMKRVKN